MRQLQRLRRFSARDRTWNGGIPAGPGGRDLGQLLSITKALMTTTPVAVTPTSLSTKEYPSSVMNASYSDDRGVRDLSV